MNLFDRLNAWMDRSEVSWVTLLTKFLPIMVPIIPAIQTKNHVVTVLGYETWQGWVAAGIVEFFGYASMYKMMQFAFKKAGFWMVTFAVVIYLFYLGTIVAFNVLPELQAGRPSYIIWMNSLFALLSVPASALTAISAIHTERSEEERTAKEAERAERKAERERRRLEREQTQTNEHRTPNTPARTPNRRTNEQLPQPVANERRTFKPYPNEHSDTEQRIRQTAERLQAAGIIPSVRNVQRQLRIDDYKAQHNQAPTPEQLDGVSGWSVSTINKVLNPK